MRRGMLLTHALLTEEPSRKGQAASFPTEVSKVRDAVANWPGYAKQADVSRKSTKEIEGKIKLQ